MENIGLHHGSEFDDPTSLERQSNPRLLKTVVGLSLLLCLASFLSYVWELRWSGKGVEETGIFEKGARPENNRWGWKPYRLEYQLYLDSGYKLDWLESDVANEIRYWLGDYSPFFELFALRVSGMFRYAFQVGLFFVFFLSLGSVRYYDKRFQFKHISSTFNNAAIKVLFTSFILSLVWCAFPFGIEIPVIGGIPTLTKLSGFGVVWLSSPLLGAFVYGALYCLVAYILGANFSRDI